MNTSRTLVRLSTVAVIPALLAGAPHAWAMSLGGKVFISDTATQKMEHLTVGHTLDINCNIWSDGVYSSQNVAWVVRIELDGKLLGDQTGPQIKANVYGGNSPTQSTRRYYDVHGQWLASSIGTHTARCILDPGKKLESVIPNLKLEAIPLKSFVVDVAPALSLSQGRAAPVSGTARTDRVAAPGGRAQMTPSTEVAQNPTIPLALPELKLVLGAQVLNNCGKGQDVIRVHGRVTNVGSGFAVIPSGYAMLTVGADAGVFGGSASFGTLAPGQVAAVNILLKPKNLPVKPAGAMLKLDAWLDKSMKIKQSGYAAQPLSIPVKFPPDYCAAAQSSLPPGAPANDP